MTDQIYSVGNLAETALHEQPTLTRKLALGTFIDKGTNQRYRYAHITSGILPGHLYVQERDSGYDFGNTNGSLYVQCVANGPYGGRVGDTVIKVHSAVGLSADAFVDGTFVVSTGIGQGGGAYNIDSYETGAAGKVTKIKLAEPLRQKLGNTSRIRIHKNPYQNLTECTGDDKKVSAVPRGVAIISADGGTSGFCFIQTRGYGTAIAKDAVIFGENLVPGTVGGLSGNGTISAVGPRPIVAVALSPAGSGDFVSCDFKIE